MNLEYREYEVKRLVNVHKHVDGPWFWGKYTAHPYVGCRSGCSFCYLRGSRYLGRQDPARFDQEIGIKMNAIERLRFELDRLEPDIIACGDWQQPAEARYGLSRQMLEVALEKGFAVYIVERSPLLTRDLDLLIAINEKTWAGVSYSMSNVDPELKMAFEPRSPGLRRRLEAVSALASAGIEVGVSLMPVIPFVGDTDEQLEDAVRAAKESGASYVLAGGLTMDGVQGEWTLAAARRFDERLARRFNEMYAWEGEDERRFSPPQEYRSRLGLRVRDLCARYGLSDRMPRPVPPGPLAVNKRVAERLFLMTYDLELEGSSPRRIWAYRRGAWAVDECDESIDRVYQEKGVAGLRGLRGIGPKLSRLIERWLLEADAKSRLAP